MQEVPQVHQVQEDPQWLQEDLQVEDSKGDHLEALKVLQNEARLQHHHHIPEGSKGLLTVQEIFLVLQLAKEVPWVHNLRVSLLHIPEVSREHLKRMQLLHK